MNPYMTNPNAELYAMLGQRAANLDRQGGGVSAGAGIEFDLLDKQSALAELAATRSEDREGRARALDAITRRGEMQSQEEFMLRMAERQKQLMFEEQDLELELASADADSRDALLAQLVEKQKTLLDFNNRKLSAEAEMARRSPEMAKAYSQRLSQVSQTAEGLSEFKKQFAGTLNAETTLANFLANPNKGGFRAQAPIGSVLGGIASGFESIRDVFSSTKVDETGLATAGRSLGAGGADMLAAAMQSQGLNEAIKSQGFEDLYALVGASSELDGRGLVQYDDKGNIITQSAGLRANAGSADKFSNSVLADLVITGLSNSGTNLDMNKATPAMTKLIGELNDISRSSVPMKAADVAARLKPLIDSAAVDIFGEAAEASAPKLLEVLDETFKAASKQAGKYSGSILQDGNITAQSIQNAALGKALERAAALSHTLKAGTKNQYLTSEALSRVIGAAKTESLVDPITGQVNYGILNLDPTTEMGAQIRSALGSKTVGELEDFLGFVRSSKAGEASLTREKGLSELSMMQDILRGQAEAQRRGIANRREIIAAKRKPAKKK